MSSRAWIAGIALGLALNVVASAQETTEPAPEGEPIPGPRQEQGRETGKQDSDPELQPTPDLMPALQGIESAIRDLVAEEDAADREAQRNRDEADLRAQQTMAVWAMWMFFAALGSLLLTGVGVVLIWRTLLYTRDAAKYAKVAAEASQAMVTQAEGTTAAAQESVKVAWTSHVAAQRPWITIDASLESGLTFNVNNAALVNISVQLRNIGKSAAKDVEIHAQCFTLSRAQANKAFFVKLYGGVRDAVEKRGPAWAQLILPSESHRHNQTVSLLRDAISRDGTIQNGERIILPVIVVCATYRFADDNSLHQTAIIFRIFRRENDDMVPQIVLSQGDLLAEQIALRRDLGEYAIAD